MSVKKRKNELERALPPKCARTCKCIAAKFIELLLQNPFHGWVLCLTAWSVGEARHSAQPHHLSSQSDTAIRVNDSIRSEGGLILISSAGTKDPPRDWGKDAFWLTSASEHLLPCEWSQQWWLLPKTIYTLFHEKRDGQGNKLSLL